jgi:peptidoglycan/LPS O-acetylase OafA/YrhL
LGRDEPVGATHFRADLEGLRAIAVVLVVLFHAGVGQLSGGYVGVDVFFVLSGYLITGLLLRELRSTDRVSLPSFYARRARRILPASFLVLAVTLAASAVILSPVRFAPVTKDVAAAAVYVPNIRFALQQTDYWHPAAISPILHFWSLGVEEQFYLLWPTFLLLAWRFGARSSRGLGFWVGAVTLGSLVLSVVLTPPDPTSSFYLLHTRAWELGLGALLVLGTGRLRNLPSWPAAAAGWTGLLMIGAAAVMFDASTPFPGVAALVPVVGTGLVIVAGTRGPASWPQPQPLLVAGPMQFFGRISYSLYLWHWPVLILGAVVAGAIDPAISVPIEVALAVLLAAATYRWVEDPLRRGRLVGALPRRNLSMAAVASVALVVVAIGTGRVVTQRFAPDGSGPAAAVGETVAGALPQLPDALASPTPSAGGAPASPTASVAVTVDGPLPKDLLPSLLSPLSRGPAAAPPAHCGLNDPDTVSPACVSGDPGSATTVVLFGDSHAMQWYPAVERIAVRRHWRLVTLVKASCPYEDVTMRSGTRVFTECDTWRANAFARIADEHPALVIVAGNHRLTPAASGDARDLMLDGVAATIDRLEAAGSRVAVLGDTPAVPFDPIDCLSRNPDHTIACAVDRSVLFDDAWLAGERARTEAAGATFVDTASWLCPTEPCPLVLGRYLVYRDTNHLALPLSWALTARLDAALVPD